MLRRRATISRARALEFQVPSVDGASGARPAFNAVILLEALVGEERIQGLGEVDRRARAETGDAQTGTWCFLKTALEQLEEVRIPTRAGPARAFIANVMGDLAQLANGTLRRQQPEPPYRGALAGIDIALVDLGAKVARVPVSRLLGGRDRSVPEDVWTIRNGFPGQVATGSDGRSVIKLSELKDHEAALEATSVAVRAAGAKRPLSLDLHGQLTSSDALKLVEALVERIRRSEAPPHILLQRPIDASNYAGLGELQSAADSGVPHDSDRPGVVVMAEVWSRDDALRLVGEGVRGVNLNLQRIGGTLAAIDVTRRLHDASPDIRLALSSVPRTFGITGRALAELASALPGLDYLEPPEPSGSHDVVETTTAADRGQLARLAHGGEHGLGVRLSLAPVVGLVRRRIEIPEAVPRTLEYGSMKANEFELKPVKGFATYGWGIPLTNHLLERAALARGLNTTRLWNGVFVADHTDLSEPIGFAMRRSGWTGASARRVADDKELARRMLEAAGVPTPQGAAFRADEVEKAVDFARSLGAPVVVKPRDGSHGIGVSTDLGSDDEVRSAILASQESRFGRGRDFVIEEYVTGNDYRVIVIGDRVASVVHRRPAFVTGDGRSSVVDLVLEKNLAKLENPHGCTRLIPLGQDAELWLRRQDLTLSDIPEEGREVRLCSVANGSLGADPIEILDETHQSILELAVQATRAVPGLDHCGVDIIGNHRRGVDGHVARVIEVNTAPGTLLNHYPMFGNPRDVSNDLVVRSCALRGFTPPRKRDELSVRIEAHGVVHGVGYRQWFAGIAKERDLTGSVRNLPEGSVQAYVSGTANDVAALVSRAFVGPRRAFVDRVVTTHVDDVRPADRFVIL